MSNFTSQNSSKMSQYYNLPSKPGSIPQEQQLPTQGSFLGLDFTNVGNGTVLPMEWDPNQFIPRGGHGGLGGQPMVLADEYRANLQYADSVPYYGMHPQRLRNIYGQDRLRRTNFMLSQAGSIVRASGPMLHNNAPFPPQGITEAHHPATKFLPHVQWQPNVSSNGELNLSGGENAQQAGKMSASIETVKELLEEKLKLIVDKQVDISDLSLLTQLLESLKGEKSGGDGKVLQASETNPGTSSAGLKTTAVAPAPPGSRCSDNDKTAETLSHAAPLENSELRKNLLCGASKHSKGQEVSENAEVLRADAENMAMAKGPSKASTESGKNEVDKATGSESSRLLLILLLRVSPRKACSDSASVLQEFLALRMANW
ncbi:hypothetical protein CDL15_Pgr018841 [Punica granatum]|uniref:Uncharacterized protein n=1 Tax=Punica granatum TaxID=22663 RepID=A0A218VVH3_PUNGR|nr:hypothetical protein CDL15_Pgr018841 [Punica granatum]